MEGVLNMSEQNLKQVLAKKQSILQGLSLIHISEPTRP